MPKADFFNKEARALSNLFESDSNIYEPLSQGSIKRIPRGLLPLVDIGRWKNENFLAATKLVFVLA